MLALIMVAFTSCDDTISVPDVKMVDVTFDLENLNLSNKFDGVKTANKEVFTKDDGTSIPYPECATEEATYVKVIIDGTEYTIDFTALPGNSTTEVIQLAEGTYSVEEFTVYGPSGPLYSAPEVGSNEVINGGLKGVPFDFTLGAFTKSKVSVDVVCWHEFSYQPLAWNWFEIDRNQVKTLCFFGDVCTKFYQDFGANDYDVIAAIEVEIFRKDGSGAWESIATGSNQDGSSFTGIAGSPLCVEYVDNETLNAEEFAFTLTLLTPTGPVVLEDKTPFDDGAYSADDGAGNFGGSDGVWNFNVGECGNTSDEANYPAYLPLPTNLIQFKLIGEANQPDGFYRLEVGGFTGNFAFAPGQFNGWCVDYDTTIYYGIQYEARVWSLLDIASIPDQTRLNLIKAHAGKLHWIINHLDDITAAGFSPEDIQDMIWWLVSAKGPATAAVKTYAAGVVDYSPKVGDFAMLIFDPYIQDDDTRVQAFGVRIDP